MSHAMRTALALVAAAVPTALSAQSDASRARQLGPPRVIETTLLLDDGSDLRYGIALPDGHESGGEPRPLVLALHPGGRGAYYGSAFMRSVVEPALRSWGAILIAPDVPDGSWATPRSEGAVVALVERVRADYAIDPDRILVTGFSMGGRGTWHLAARRPDVFSGAIVMAGSPGQGDIGSVGVPLYLIHSPDDEVVPFAPVEEAFLALAERGHSVEMRVLPGAGHYQMGAYVPALRMAGAWMLDAWSEPRP